jgi:hypothetical protein
MKQWLYLMLKAFVNDCSVGLTLIILGFLLGWMSQNIWVFIRGLLHVQSF